MRAAPLVALFLAVSAVGSHAAGPTPEAAARGRLSAANDEIKRAFALLDGGYGSDPAAESQRIEQAARVVGGVEAALIDELSSSPAAYQTVKENLRALQGELESARLAQTYSAGEAAVRAKHKAGEPASAEELTALEQTLTALGSRTGPGWRPTLAHFTSRLTRLKQDREKLASAKAVSAQADAPSAALLDAFRAANRERRNVERLLEDQSGAVPAAALEAYLMATSKVSALSERAGRYYTTVYRQFLVANAWRQPDEQAFATLPNLYQGELTDHGSARGKLLSRFVAKEGWCYALLGRFTGYTGAEGVANLKWSAQGNDTTLTRFDIPHTGPGYQVTHGACASQGTRLSLKATLEGAERDNPLRFVVVGWPKESLPPFVATYMRLYAEDRCDDDAWHRAWTRPVPGSLLYRGSEPLLVADAARPPGDDVTLVNVNGDRVTVKKSELSSKPPKTRAFETQFTFNGCPTPSGKGSPEAEKLAKCLERIEKKYVKSMEREEGWVARATTDSAREKAQARLDALKGRWDNERAQQCDPLEARLRERVKRTFDRILDLHMDNEVIVSFDRGDQLKAEQEARPDLR